MATTQQTTDATAPVELWAGENGIADSKLHSEYMHRLTAGRDMHVIVTAASETGVGKTTLAFALAWLWDQPGWHVGKACVADASKYSRLYDDVERCPPGSVLLLDEAEKAVDARRSMQEESVELSQDFASKRYRQIFGILTAPTKGWVDKRIGADSADYWIQAQETPQGKPKGEAVVYRLKTNEHYERQYTTREEVIEWPVLDDHPQFYELNRIKEEELEGTGESRYIRREEVEKIKQEVRKEVRREAEREILQGVYETVDCTYDDLAKATDLSRGTLASRINS